MVGKFAPKRKSMLTFSSLSPAFILQWVSDRPLAKISKWSHFMLWPVDVTWVGNSRWVIATRNGFEVLRFPVMQSTFSFQYPCRPPGCPNNYPYKQPWTFEHGWDCLCREKETQYDACSGTDNSKVKEAVKFIDASLYVFGEDSALYP